MISAVRFIRNHRGKRRERKLEIRYVPNISSQEDYKLAISQAFETDRFRGNTSRGPHRDDFEVFINDINVRNFGSQGQQRTAALSIKLAEIALIGKIKPKVPYCY